MFEELRRISTSSNARRLPIYVIAFTLAVFSLSLAQDIDRIPIPEGLFYYNPASTVFGIEAAWINPAQLSRSEAGSYQLLADYFDGKFARSYGFAVGKESITMAYRYLDKPDQGIFKEWVFAAGLGLPGGMLGASYRYFASGPGLYDNRHFWNIGLSGQSGYNVRWGAVFSNLNRSSVDGHSTAVEMRYSLGYRPFGRQATFAVDMFLSTRDNIKEADYVYHLEARPSRGLFLYGSIDSDKNFTLGFRTNLLQYFVGSRSRFDEDFDGRGTTMILGATAMRQPSVIDYPRRRLTVSMSGRPQEKPVRPVFGKSNIPFTTLIRDIYRAANDPSIGEMLVKLNGFSAGFGQAQELREAIGYFRAHDKVVTCYLGSPNNIAYYIACAADSILIPPVSQLYLVGLRAELTYYAGTLDKIGVDVELLRIGDYKSAAEPWIRDSSSVETREQLNRMLDSYYGQFVNGIADGRGISADSVRAIVDGGPYTSKEAIENGLVDGLSYDDRIVPEFLSERPEISFRRYVKDTLMNDSWRPRPRLAVVVAEGDIAEKPSRNPLMPRGDVTPSGMDHAFKQALADDLVQGIVFRINSPGGEAIAGDRIEHFARNAAKKRPLVVSMSNVAASGGYYITTPAQKLYANPGTMTGSIGIYGGKVDLSGLYDKIDLGKELYTRGRFAGMMTFMRPFSEAEREKYYSQLEAFYDHFVEIVADNQNLSADSVDHLSRGRVWTGEQARQNGLVDELGGLHHALENTAAELGLSEYDVVIFPEERPLIILPGSSFIHTIASVFSGHDDPIKSAAATVMPDDNATLMTRLPFNLTIE